MDNKYQRQGKDTKARNDINDRLNNLHINHYIEKPKNDLHDNVNKNFKETLKKVLLIKVLQVSIGVILKMILIHD